MGETNRKAVRAKPVNPAVQELLWIANELPRPKMQKRQRAERSYESVQAHAHDNILNAHKYGNAEEWTSRYLEEALKRLPVGLQAFVTRDLTLHRAADGTLSFGRDDRWQQTGPNLLNYAVEIDKFESDVESMRQRYIFLFAVRDLLLSIARPDVVEVSTSTRWEVEARPPASIDPEAWLEGAWRSARHQTRLYQQVTGLRSWISLSKKTRYGTHEITVHRPLLFQVLEGVEAERIRQCPVCEKLFWAGRLDQPACGARCANILRGRLHRRRVTEKATDVVENNSALN